MYQDLWVKGKLVQRGVRECENRFEAIASVLDKIPGPLRVLDFGGHTGYFSFRIAERFNRSRVLLATCGYADEVNNAVNQNNNPSVTLLYQQQSPESLRALIKEHNINVVLALSVLHNNKNWKAMYDAISGVETLFVETIALDEKGTINSHLAQEIIQELCNGRIIARTPARPGQEKDLRPLYHIDKRIRKGVFCEFDPITGIKTYKTEEMRNNAYTAQSIAAKRGLGPDVFEKIGDLSYRSGIADTSFFEKYFPAGVYCQSVFKDLHDALLPVFKEVYGSQKSVDLHARNLGIYNNRVVTVDFY